MAPQGNQNRTLWKARAASDEALDMYQRAVYAIPSGDIKNTLPACQSWEDYLWANVTCLMEHKIQQKLYESAHMLIQVPPISLNIPSFVFSEKDIFDSLFNHDSPSIRDITTEMFHSFQMHFILNDMFNFFANIQEQLMQLNIDETIDEGLKHGLRFLTQAFPIAMQPLLSGHLE